MVWQTPLLKDRFKLSLQAKPAEPDQDHPCSSLLRRFRRGGCQRQSSLPLFRRLSVYGQELMLTLSSVQRLPRLEFCTKVTSVTGRQPREAKIVRAVDEEKLGGVQPRKSNEGFDTSGTRDAAEVVSEM